MKLTRILIADDHPILLKGLKTLLKEKGYVNLWTAEDGLHALQIIKDHSPDLAILDIKMPGKSGIEIARICAKQYPETRIIFLSYHTDPEFIELSKSLNIKGFLPKENSTMEIERCIRSVWEGELYFPSLREDVISGEVARKLLQSLESLTSSELRILEMISRGLPSHEIAGLLHISERTVEKHRSNMVQKLDVDCTYGNLNLWVSENKDFLTEYF